MKIRFNLYQAALVSLLALITGYALYYFNYYETPTADYVGNIIPPVQEYMSGIFPGSNYKFMPLYPLVLAGLTKFIRLDKADPIYLNALVFNMALFPFYLWIVLRIYRKFLSEWASLLAALFLGANIFTIYTATNAELEMLLSFLIALSLLMALEDRKLSYLGAFFTAVTKWDAPFIIPAVMFRDFFYRKKRLLAVGLGILAGTGIAAWFTLSVLHSLGYANPYVGEIAKRGPNIYRFPVDCLLIATGFIQWMGMNFYFSGSWSEKIPLVLMILFTGISFLALFFWGLFRLIKNRLKDFFPALVFLGGFLLVHMVYQNTKERYVLPILWALVLFLFYGIFECFAPFLKTWFEKKSGPTARRIIAFTAIAASFLYLATLLPLLYNKLPQVVFALLFLAMAAFIISRLLKMSPVPAKVAAAASAGVIINLMVFYGAQTMDHYSYRNAEFKQVAQWYKENAAAADVMLITEVNLPKYYTKFSDEKFHSAWFIESKTLEDLIPELARKKVSLVFVDDFYVRRLKMKDKNALDKKAWLFEDIRNRGENTGHFRLVKKFDTRGPIYSYLYKFIP